jgi:hypothetical protein
VPPQHDWPTAPHWQVLDAQVRLALHALPLQHGSLEAPHAVQLPLAHPSPLLHAVPPQHAWPLAPH